MSQVAHRLPHAALTVSLLALASIIGSHPAKLAGQQLPAPGSRVRVTAPDCGLSGQPTTYETVRADTLVLESTECPLASVTELDTYVLRRRAGRGALIGGLVGGASLALVYGAVFDACGYSCETDSLTYGAAFAVGALSGALLGAVVGFLIRSDRWEEVPLERLRVSFGSQQFATLSAGVSVTH